MPNFELLCFTPRLPEPNPLADELIQFVNGLELPNKVIQVFFPSELSSEDANAELDPIIPRIKIRDVETWASLELRLAHELSHLSLLYCEYSSIEVCRCSEEDVNQRNQTYYKALEGVELANLLHHLILCPKLVDNGFVVETVPSIDRIDEKISGYIGNYQSQYNEGRTSIIMGIMNNILMTNNFLPDTYSQAIGRLPGALEEAQRLLATLNTRYNNFSNISIAQYHSLKEDIHRELGIQSEYPFI